MKHLKMAKIGLIILKRILVFSVLFTACQEEKSGLHEYVEQNNAYSLYPVDQSNQDSCYSVSFLEEGSVKFKYYLINNNEQCSGRRSVSHYPNYDIFTEGLISLNNKEYVRGFEDHLNALGEREVRNMDVQIFTNLKKGDLKKISSLTDDLTKTFYRLKCKEKFIPLNILIIYNADEMLNSMKSIPDFPPELEAGDTI